LLPSPFAGVPELPYKFDGRFLGGAIQTAIQRVSSNHSLATIAPHSPHSGEPSKRAILGAAFLEK
jgi:hypothetical protein